MLWWRGPVSCTSSPKGHSMSMNLKRFFKFREAEAALHEAESKQCADEEKLFHSFPDRVVSSIDFEEKSFGGSDYPSANIAQGLSSIVVSLALFDGDRMLFACSGIRIPHVQSKARLSRFVTSARLVEEFDRHRNRDDKLRVEVRIPDGRTTDGFLGLYDNDIAIVTTLQFLGVKPVDLDAPAVAPEGSIIAAGRGFKKGNLMTMNVSATESNSTWISDSPNFSEAVLGGPLVEVKNPSDGNGMRFLGMNLIRRCDHDDANVRYSFLSRELLRQRLKHFGLLDFKEFHFRDYSLPDGVSTIIPPGFVHAINRIKALGYPIPPPLVLEFNGRLLNRFEGLFGRVRAWTGYPFGCPPAGSGENVWKRLPKKVVTDISRRVVSLASFKGHSRFFACSGLLIKWHGRTLILTSASLFRGHDGVTIDKSLRIEVFLPPKQRANGTLELYNISSNYAIVSIDKNFHSVRPEDIFNEKLKKSPKNVVAVGRDALRGLLMASMGEVKPGNSEYDMLSTCIINKAGIGGPLIDFSGSFVGTNFYNGSKLTPVVPKSKIVEALGRVPEFELQSARVPCIFYSSMSEFITREGPMEIDDNGVLALGRPELDIARWNAPKPYWCHGELDVYRYHIPILPGRTLH